MPKFIVGSRRSQLALTQSKQFINTLKQAHPELDIEIKEIVTKGDEIVNVQLSKVGGKGLFVKEIEQALFNKEIDMAIHSLKDVPSELPDGLQISCIPSREDRRDAYIANDHLKLKDLAPNSVVGTSSLRRGAQIKSIRPDVEIQWIRGNIDTRLKKLNDGQYDAIILAAAGLHRMGWSEDVITEYLEPELMIPAIGQGALGIETRVGSEIEHYLKSVHDDETARTTTAERIFLAQMDGSCKVPIGGYATINEQDEVQFTGLIMSEDGQEKYMDTATHHDAKEAGLLVAKALYEQGAKEIIDRLNEEM